MGISFHMNSGFCGRVFKAFAFIVIHFCANFLQSQVKLRLILVLLFFGGSFYAQKDSVNKAQGWSDLSLEELMDLTVVTSSKSAIKISEAPSSMLVITAKQIKERGYEELDDMLRDISGIDLIHVSGTYPVVRSFRGMYGEGNQRLLLMIDGVVENNLIGSYEMGGPAYSLHNVEKIEILWGPGSALYGANAFGGVIHIFTKKGSNIKGFEFERGYGKYNTSFEKVMLGLKKGGFDVAVSGTLFRSDGPSFKNRTPSFSTAYVDNAWSLNGSIAYNYKNSKTIFSYRAYDTPQGIGTYFATPTQLLGYPSQGNGNIGNIGHIPSNVNGERSGLWEPFSRTTSLQNELVFQDKFTLSSRVTYRETGLSEKSYLYVIYSPNSPIYKFLSAHYSNRIEGEMFGVLSPNENNNITFGIQASQSNLEHGYRETNFDSQIDTINSLAFINLRETYQKRTYTIQNNIGTYAQYCLNTRFLKKTNFTMGMRFDNNSVYGNAINPRVGIITQPFDKLSFKLLFGTAYRAPTNFELYNKTPLRLPNEGLKPEKVKTYEVNINYKPVKSFFVKINCFRNEMYDIIMDDSVSGGFIQTRNIGSATINGIEAKLDLFFYNKLSGFVNFTYQEGRQKHGVLEHAIPNIANVKGNAGLNLKFNKLFTLSVIENWVGERTTVSTNPINKVGAYFVTNLVISTDKIFDGRISASINIRNLFNQTYFDPGIRFANGELFSTVLEQPGINALFKVGIHLN